jgi:hypothetical protein
MHLTAPTITYINQLRSLQNDLDILMADWPEVPSFYEARRCAETIAPLVAGQIDVLINASICLNEAEPMKLRSALEELLSLITGADEKRKFAEYVVMLDSLINDGLA